MKTREELVAMQKRHLDVLLGLAQTLDGDNRLPLQSRVSYVKRELALVCKDLLASIKVEQ